MLVYRDTSFLPKSALDRHTVFTIKWFFSHKIAHERGANSKLLQQKPSKMGRAMHTRLKIHPIFKKNSKNIIFYLTD